MMLANLRVPPRPTTTSTMLRSVRKMRCCTGARDPGTCAPRRRVRRSRRMPLRILVRHYHQFARSTVRLCVMALRRSLRHRLRATWGAGTCLPCVWIDRRPTSSRLRMRTWVNPGKRSTSRTGISCKVLLSCQRKRSAVLRRGRWSGRVAQARAIRTLRTRGWSFKVAVDLAPNANVKLCVDGKWDKMCLMCTGDGTSSGVWRLCERILGSARCVIESIGCWVVLCPLLSGVVP
ncbi:hypothetical protein BDV93DRAFT_362780 [Ceratobasidium sp. AG-I]|nr:hypothetical protein BDV93DRAFT_362780 [Ceratobasidium sp. AG-I]